MKTLNEGLEYLDLKDQLSREVTIDEYAAKMGKDSEIVTVTFSTKSGLAAKDLVSWLEFGYDFVLDANNSPGEITPGKHLIFMELKRKSSVINKILLVLSDLETLTGYKLKDWKIKVGNKTYKADEDALGKVIKTSPQEYKKMVRKEKQLNKMKEIAGLEIKVDETQDPEIRQWKTIAGL